MILNKLDVNALVREDYINLLHGIDYLDSVLNPGQILQDLAVGQAFVWRIEDGETNKGIVAARIVERDTRTELYVICFFTTGMEALIAVIDLLKKEASELECSYVGLSCKPSEIAELEEKANCKPEITYCIVEVDNGES